jgi:hypothetical protein
MELSRLGCALFMRKWYQAGDEHAGLLTGWFVRCDKGGMHLFIGVGKLTRLSGGATLK